MADQLGSAVLTLSVDDTQYKAGLNGAQREAQSASQKIGRTFDGLAGTLRGLAGVAGVVGIGALTTQLVSTGQQAQRSEVQLRALAGAYGEANQAGQAAARIQQVLGISTVEATSSFAELYAALRGTGIGLKELEVLFIGISNAARLSGAGTAEASAALLQLKQGLAAGRLQGDELRSVLEQLPAFSQAIAQELGVSVGQLRQLGSEGKITSDIVFNAAKRLATAVTPGRTEVEKIGIAFQNLQAQAAKAIGPALVNSLSTVAAGLIAFREFLKANQEGLTLFAKSVVALGKALLPLAAGILAVRAAFKAWAIATKAVAVAQAAVLALQGPKGWAVLAVALGAAYGASRLLEAGLKGVETAVGAAGKEAEKARAQFAALLGGTSLTPGALPVDPKQEGRSRVQSVESAQALQGIQRQIAAAQELGNAEAGVVREAIRQRQEIEAGVQASRERVQLIGAQIEALRLQGKDSGPELDKLVSEQVVASEEVRLKLIEGATALRDAGKQLRDDLKAAKLTLADTVNDPNGLNKFLTPEQQGQRAQQQLQQLLPDFRIAQQQFTQRTGATAPEFTGSSTDVVSAVTDFIRRVDAEINAGRDVNSIQQALAQNTADLVSINTQLATVVQELAGKNWLVNVNVPGGTASGDVVGALNGAL